jgi:hypothetical protein
MPTAMDFRYRGRSKRCFEGENISSSSLVSNPVSWFETRQRVRAERGPMINSDALLTVRVRNLHPDSDLILRV